jgi:hypothetical protein
VEGYSVTEAASVLGVPTERVWELLARGVLSGSPEGETGMRVFLQPRPAPRAAIEEPRAGNGDATPRPAEAEPSPFRELLTEFRNLTERYGQALLALGEARGEVASLRSRVDLLEARFDLRLPMSGPAPQPGSPWAPRAVVEPARGDVGASGSAQTAEHDVEEPPRRKRSRGQRRATDEFAEALARAEDPTPAELPGAADAGAAFAALREETASNLDTEAETEAALPRDVPAAEPMATLEPEPEPMATAEPEPEPMATLEREPIATLEPKPEPMAEPEPEPEPMATAEPEPEPMATLEREPIGVVEAVEASGAAVEPPVAAVSEPVATVEPELAPEAEEKAPPAAAVREPVSAGDAAPAVADTSDDVEAAAGTVVRFETATEPERPAEPAHEREPARAAGPELESEPEPVAASDVPADVEVEREEWADLSRGGAVSEIEPVDEAGPSWSTSITDEVQSAPSSDVNVAGAPTEVPAAEAQPAADDERTPDEPSWDRQRYTTDIEEPDWIPEEPTPKEWSVRPATDLEPDPMPTTGDRIDSEAFGWSQEETERWFASGQDPPSATDESIGDDDQAIQKAEASSEEVIEPVPAPIEDPAEEMEVAGASGHGGAAAQPVWEVDEQPVEPAAPPPWAPAPSPPPAWMERFPPGAPRSPTTTEETGTASRAYRRLRRIFPG